jgi:hypothetical protein
LNTVDNISKMVNLSATFSSCTNTRSFKVAAPLLRACGAARYANGQDALLVTTPYYRIGYEAYNGPNANRRE